jgi:hypothetical protein
LPLNTCFSSEFSFHHAKLRHPVSGTANAFHLFYPAIYRGTQRCAQGISAIITGFCNDRNSFLARIIPTHSMPIPSSETVAFLTFHVEISVAFPVVMETSAASAPFSW